MIQKAVFFSTPVHCLVVALLLLLGSRGASAQDPVSPADLLAIAKVKDVSISPNGDRIAYTVESMRPPTDAPGYAYAELFVVDTKTGTSTPLITGPERVLKPAWSPDGQSIGFLANRANTSVTQVWTIGPGGGEAVQITASSTKVEFFRWHPDGKSIGYIAESPKTDREQKLSTLGYEFIFFEEDLKPQNLFLIDVTGKGTAKQITPGFNVWSFEFTPDGKSIAVSKTDKNLIDQKYMDQRVYLMDIASGSMKPVSQNPGKLGNYALSPDGQYLAYAAALERKDNAPSQAFVIPVSGGTPKNLTIQDFKGHIDWVGWKDKSTVLYHAGEGTETTLSSVSLNGGPRKIVLHSQKTGIVFNTQEVSADGQHWALIGGSPSIPGDLFYAGPDGAVKRLTEVNPWLKERTLGKQEVIRYQARDGWDVEGILLHPAGYEPGKQYPLVVIVHGGPESHYSNEWTSNYSRPGQVLAGKGYAVFFPNYRASTGYGLKFAAAGYNDAAGPEFDDIADGIDYLIGTGLVDENRVGLGGGSYGGFCSAWFATYYTKYVKAVAMFVGISDLISKRGTTDIPYEELFVHSGKKLEDMWEQSMKRSPIYWAHQSKTAVLIYGGTKDTRVHPSQSLEFYRRLKMNDHPAVRLVQYPGEKHGNAKQPGQIDVLFRILDWYDWYVRDAKPLDGPMPPLDISDRYGLTLE